MIQVIIIGLLICYAIFPFFRCLLKNLHFSSYYLFKDIFYYFHDKKWQLFGYYGIDMYVGMFGKGKTLAMTHKAQQLYDRYGDNLRFISNYHLENIPYIPLINFQQLVDLGTEENDKYVGNVVLIDEISTLLSHRNFSSFPLEMLSLLLQQRKRHTYICCTSQRFFMVDKIWRSITTNVIDCNKIWRFENMKTYDAWDYENCINTELLKFNNNYWWFVRDRDYNGYDTSQMITKQSADDFISNEQVIIRKGLDSMDTRIENVKTKHIRKKRVNKLKR